MVKTMRNKVLVKVEFIEYNVIFEIFIPVNEIIWKISLLIQKSVADLLGVNSNKDKYVIINKKTNEVYDVNKIVRETDIRNGTELIFY